MAGKCLTPAVLLLVPFILCALPSCGLQVKITRITEEGVTAGLRLPPETEYTLPETDIDLVSPRGDTMKVTGPDGEEVLIMRARKDETTGEMVALDRIDAAVVTARFRNIAERNGAVRLEFQVTVPEYMRDSEWQVRLYPRLEVMGEERMLDGIIVTGENYRKSQLRGYEQYRRFLSRIITDSLEFIDMRNLEIFISRNIPALYAFRNDSSYVSDESFASSFGVTSREAAEHYTREFLLHRNRRLESMKEMKRRKYVKSPIVSEGVRLDTVLRGGGGEFIYNYVQMLPSRPGMRKVDVFLSGEIFGQDRRLYTIPESGSLTFYVSSLSSLADATEKYLTRIISRNVESEMTCTIDFGAGDSRIDESLGRNRQEMEKIRRRLGELLTDSSFVMDSILIVASASPEGSLKSNMALSYSRAKSVSEYFSDYVAALESELGREAGLHITVDENFVSSDVSYAEKEFPEIVFRSRSGGENWVLLDRLVSADTLLTGEEKAEYFALASETDPDVREAKMGGMKSYRYIRDKLYPELRIVDFRFHLHRTGMQKDTVHTSVLDTAYMVGVRLLQDRRYEDALERLLPYADYNTAVAFVALDRNHSAMDILEKCPSTARVDYLLALVYSRLNRDREAVERLLKACSADASFIHRANLDPEISLLVDRYDLIDKLQFKSKNYEKL